MSGRQCQPCHHAFTHSRFIRRRAVMPIDIAIERLRGRARADERAGAGLSPMRSRSPASFSPPPELHARHWPHFQRQALRRRFSAFEPGRSAPAFLRYAPRHTADSRRPLLPPPKTRRNWRQNISALGDIFSAATYSLAYNVNAPAKYLPHYRLTS